MSSNKKYIYLALAIICSPVLFICNSLFILLWSKFSLPGYYPIRDYIVLPASIIALAIYIAITVVIIRNKKVYDFFNEVIMELKKVSWPSFEESKASTWVVIVVCVIFAVYLGIADILFSKIFTFFLAL